MEKTKTGRSKLPKRVSDKVITEKFEYQLVIWLRHFGCRFFQEAKLLLPDLRKKLEEVNVGLICVMQGDEEELEMFWPFEEIAAIPDPGKETYRQMGFERTSLLKILFAETDLKERRKKATSLGCSMNNQGTKSKSSDVLQLPGMALADKDNTIIWHHKSRHTGDLDLSLATVKLVKDVIDRRSRDPLA